MALKHFVEKWCHPDYTPLPVDNEMLAAAERELKIRFPAGYREQVLAVGPPSPTLALLSAIDDLQLDLNDLSALFTPPEIVDETRAWQEIGMPEHLVAIGNDCMGNKFCFSVRDLSGETRPLSAAVYFWDHDFNDMIKIADSFLAWIDSYLGPWSDRLSATDF